MAKLNGRAYGLKDFLNWLLLILLMEGIKEYGNFRLVPIGGRFEALLFKASLMLWLINGDDND